MVQNTDYNALNDQQQKDHEKLRMVVMKQLRPILQ